jgi:hypothetical protein
MITLAEILRHMESGKPFSLKVVSYDRDRKKGGEILHFEEARLVPRDLPARTDRPPTKKEALLERRQNHFSHYTRNIQIIANGTPTAIIRKIHIPLIIEFNSDKEVVD